MFPAVILRSLRSLKVSMRRVLLLSIVALVLFSAYHISSISSLSSLGLHWNVSKNTPEQNDDVYNANSGVDIWDWRAKRVRRAFVHAYSNYKQYASPHDELLPLSKGRRDQFGGFGVTVFDSLDTMYLMGLEKEFKEAVSVVRQTRFEIMEQYTRISVFETIIRHLGGLLSAHSLSDDSVLLQKAEELADSLEPAFETFSGLPWSSINTATRDPSGGYIGSLSEVASFQVELAYLAHKTGKKRYYKRVAKLLKTLAKTVPSHYEMLPTHLSLLNGFPTEHGFSVGGGADSGHEYLLKYYLLTAQTHNSSLELYMRGMNHMLTNLLFLSPERSLLYVTDRTDDGQASHVFEHLSCFLPGLLALGVHSLPASAFSDAPLSQGSVLARYNLSELHMSAAIGLGESCWLMYADQPSGLGPEEVSVFPPPVSHDPSSALSASSGLWIDAMERWREGGEEGVPPGVGQKDPEPDGTRRDYELRKPEYFLRPETIESMFYLWKTTGDVRWRERGWTIFEALERETRVEVGYASLTTVAESQALKFNEMPSYFLAETLKYLYLLFLNEDRIPLDMWVFNTEAHPLPIFNWTAWEKDMFGIKR
ncbi:hypothetical protein EIP91_003289 [Steccherinum ochraceum]|uniref:alpha-1,2-Mannosidase n=1 Tax=Steccherinum ochraceum TaxID=92696 RepID=A0A4R0RAU8_9APHY|nr:hypothetical protein EIP91_003289 [Steccherinum ochraceum]